MVRNHRWTRGGLFLSVALIFAALTVGCQAKKVEVEPPPAVEKEKGLTIILVNPTTSAALSASLSKGNMPDQDHIRWYNQTGSDVTITFTTNSPFLETETTIIVRANQFSPYYSLDRSKANGPYPYKTTPRLIPSDQGPGDPDIGVTG